MNTLYKESSPENIAEAFKSASFSTRYFTIYNLPLSTVLCSKLSVGSFVALKSKSIILRLP
jgi:hypothetical protein